jgi:hypothetical protein
LATASGATRNPISWSRRLSSAANFPSVSPVIMCTSSAPKMPGSLRSIVVTFNPHPLTGARTVIEPTVPSAFTGINSIRGLTSSEALVACTIAV